MLEKHGLSRKKYYLYVKLGNLYGLCGLNRPVLRYGLIVSGIVREFSIHHLQCLSSVAATNCG